MPICQLGILPMVVIAVSLPALQLLPDASSRSDNLLKCEQVRGSCTGFDETADGEIGREEV